MEKTTTAIAMHTPPAAKQSSSAVVCSGVSKNKDSSSGRFPPIENALINIVNNKRLIEAMRDV